MQLHVDVYYRLQHFSVSYINFLSQSMKLLDNFNGQQASHSLRRAVRTISRLIGNEKWQIGSVQIGNGQIGNSQIGNSQIGNAQIGNIKLGNAEIGRMEWPFSATVGIICSMHAQVFNSFPTTGLHLGGIKEGIKILPLKPTSHE